MRGYMSVATDVTDSSDTALVLRSRAEPGCFAELFDRYFGELHRYAARRLGRAGGDDVAAETFLVAFSQRRQFDPDRGSVRVWLYGIATNLIRGLWRDEERGYRAHARSATQAATHAAMEDQATSRVAAVASRDRILAAVADLAERDRDVLLLVVWGELSHEEVAAALAVPVGTVGSRLHRARRHLRAALSDVNPNN
jgi:RNA polymerase sigma-70 factor (ECF subfamily)